MDHPSTAWTAVYYATYPILYILNLILSILAVLAAPLIHLSHYNLYACWYMLCALGKFETLYIFFGVAALIGIVTGTSLHYILGFIISMLNLESSPEEKTGRTFASYRAEKHERGYVNHPKTKVAQKDGFLQGYEPRLREDHMNWSILNQDRGQGGLKFNTILEEEDSLDSF